MKKLMMPFVVMAAMILASGCSEKFEVGAPYKDITVVYGLLAKSDTAHYIRIQKAFLDQDKSAIDMAKTPDSSFYASLNVVIKRYTFGGVYRDSIHLNRVDLNNEGYPKQPGAFFTAPNYAYKFKDVLNADYIYRLIITNTATGAVDSSETPIIDDTNPATFYVDMIDDTSLNRGGLDFASTSIYRNIQFAGIYYPPANFNFHGQTTPVAIAQGIIRFNWVDSNTITTEKVGRFYDYNLGYAGISNNHFNYKIDNLVFYNALNSALGIAPANTARLLGRVDLYFYLGSYDFYVYQQITANQGTGLTGNEIQPIYTNIKGKDALGLYTARGSRTGKITITRNTIDSLIISPILTNANIKGTAY